MEHRVGVVVAVLFALVGCGGGPGSVAETLATIEPVRGDVKVGGESAPVIARAGRGQPVECGADGLARLTLDHGPRLLVGAGGKVTLADDDDTLELGGGRVFVEVQPGDTLALVTPKGTLRTVDGTLSIETAEGGDVRVYVVRGEVTYTAGEQRGTAHAGEELTLAAQPSTRAQVLWSDWTGGLARPGPVGGAVAPGLGMLEARVPDELGLARWPLVVRRLDVRVQVIDDLAITEVDQVFFNPASETVEGLYRVRVPESAVLQRFAVDRNGRLVDGYVREKQQAAAAYAAQVYRGSTDDPALLEWDAPGAYRAKIYPIEAGATRRIVIRYAEWLGRAHAGGARLYRYPMGGARGATPQIQEFSLAVDLTRGNVRQVRAGLGAEVEEGSVRLRRSDFRPRSDFWLELDDAESPAALLAWRADHTPPERDPQSRAIPNEADERDYFFVPLVLPESVLGDAAARPTGRDLVIVADASAGTDPAHLELGRSVVESLVAQLRPEDRVAIVTSDLALRSVGEERPTMAAATRERLDGVLDALARAPAGGATDLGAAITDAAGLLDPARPGAVVYVGDGAPTVGELGAEGLLDRMGRLPRPVRLYAVAVGTDANLELLQSLTRGGGLALRVSERSEAADAALRIHAHASRPIAQRVVVDLGTGIDNAYPRRPVDVVVGDVLPVVGRIRGDVPSQVTVTGTVNGRAFSETIAVQTRASGDAADLRLRWAYERLQHLLLEGQGREAIAELGTRYGLITPFTSYYVPSARELAQMGMSARREPEAREVVGMVALAVLSPLSVLSGCTDLSAPSGVRQRVSGADNAAQELPIPASAPVSAVAPQGAAAAEPEAAQMEATEQEERSNQDGRYARAEAAPVVTATPAAPSQPTTGDYFDAPSAAPPPPAEAAARPMRRSRAGGGEGDDGDPQPTDGVGYGGLGLRGQGGQQRAPTTPAPDTTTEAQLRERGYAAVDNSAVNRLLAGGMADPSLAGLADTAGIHGAFGGSLRPGAYDVRTTITIVTQTRPEDHQRRRCSDAANLSLDDRRSLWGERLSRAGGVSGWVDAYRTAQRDCELPTWRDRRALLDLILSQAGNVPTMVSVYQYLSDGSARSYLRGAILRRVRTPQDLRAVRDAFGLGAQVPWELVERTLTAATTPAQRIRLLRAYLVQYPDSFDLKLRLLSELEGQERLPEARRLADQLRRDPLADAGVRTAIGELYLRLGDEAEARRVFSEIVEFAPADELARRRLGDLYRAHGWFEDAYRQYQTLAEIRPDDPSVMLLLAQAAAGAGRVDEALRLEQGLAETAEPGASEGIARTALLWSSVRFAKLRAEARAAGDTAKLDALLARMRRSGVLREAHQLRASLTWSHPDAQLSLWTAHPGLSLSRPTDIAPEFGIEAFDVEEQESGAYQIEVRRSGRDTRTAVDAELVLVWNEGRPDEQVQVVPLHFEGATRLKAWTITARAVADATPSAQGVRATGGAQ